VFSDVEKNAIRRSWRLAIPIAETVADLFYRRLFELAPEYRGLFSDDMSAQKKKLIRMLAFIVKSMEWTDEQWADSVNPDEDLMLVVLALGRRHTRLYRVPPQAYAPVGAALMWTLEQGLGDALDETTRSAWMRLYDLLSKTMIMAGGVDVEGEVSIAAAVDAERNGEAALLTQLAAAGIDEARLGIQEELS
jgi:hemoglobin-like flavoprotein